MKIRPVGAELFHAGGRADRDRHDEANCGYSQFCERAQNMPNVWKQRAMEKILT
jgi:hypothetical protein